MYEFRQKVRFSDIGSDGLLRLYVLPKWFQDISIEHSEAVGIGIPYLAPKNLAWLVTSWQIVVKRMPTYNEDVIIRTWPFDFRGAFGYRNYIMTTLEGEELACGYAIWLHTDVAKMAPARILEDEVERYGMEPKISMEYASRKITLPEEMKEIDTFEIQEHYIDMYRHVNNALYVDIASDYLENTQDVQEIRVDYRKQLKAGDRVSLRMGKEENRQYIGFYDAQGEMHVSIAFGMKG